ncbi:MAG: hypothetical protein ABI140_00655 [Jatrophihabitantaceae bacterium]
MKSHYARAAVALVMTAAGTLLAAGPASAGSATPTLALTRACPGATATLTGTGFADGSYLLHTMTGTLSTSLVTATGGKLSPSPVLSLPTRPVHDFAIWASPQAGGSTVAQVNAAIAVPNIVADNGYAERPLRQHGDCFAPGERVSVSPSPTISSSAATADAHGVVHLSFDLHPGQQLSYPTATLAGQSSGQLGVAQLYPLPGTTLFAGQTLSDASDPSSLMSASSKYELFPIYGTLLLQSYDGPPLWTAGADPSNQHGSRLVMQTDGNLVFFSGAGKVLWASGTAGSGSNNLLILQNDGNAVMFTSHGTPIWSSQVGVIGAPNNLHSFAYAAASRPLVRVVVPSPPPGRPVQPVPPTFVPGPAVYLNGLMKQAIWTGTLVRSVHRVAYLQRYLAGHWQNMLARTTDSAGQLAVGFIQPKAYAYRWVMPRTATAAAATSSQVVR